MPRPRMFPLMALVPMALVAATAVASIATWRRVRRLERALESGQHLLLRQAPPEAQAFL